jgi:GNAT superfamily N-acetyltransferase
MDVLYKCNLPSVGDFWNLFATTGWNEEYRLTADELFSAIARSSNVISAYLGSSLVGFGRVVSDGKIHAMIYDLIVAPEHQGKGIGAEILNRLVERCKADGIRDIQLFAAKGKRGFYEHRGFSARMEDAPGMEYVAGDMLTSPG